MVQAAKLAVQGQGDNAIARDRPVGTSQQRLLRDALHLEWSGHVVGGASQSTIGAFHRPTLAADRPIDAGREAQ